MTNLQTIIRSMTILGTMCLGLILSAQENVVSTRKANNADGRMLTMEETILSRSLSPDNLYCRWHDSGNLILFRDGNPKMHDIRTGKETDYVHSHTQPMAFTEGKSLYIRKVGGQTVPIAESESEDITYGQFVSRNEFGIEDGIFWAPDSTRLAFYRKDESKVTKFPLLDITTRTGSLREIRYPMAGMDSENVQVGIYNLADDTVTYIQADDFGYDMYLTNITWTPDASALLIQVLDRSQKHMRLNMYDAGKGTRIKTLLSEDNERYVEPMDPVWFVKGSNDRFIYRTDNRDGYRNLYLCDMEGNVERLTKVDADVAYLANDGKYVWYTSAEISPVENHLFRVRIDNGKTERLTEETGWHDIIMSPDCRHYVDSWSRIDVPRVTDLCTSSGKVVKNLLSADDPTEEYAYTEISLGTVRSADGKYMNYYRLIKPKDFDPAKEYPVIVYVYGGPHSQMVKNTFMAQLRRWEMYMAQRGYLVYVQDNRGTQNRGSEFEKAIHGRCGQAEMADQMEGVKMLMELPYVDKDRIGVHGWSYGGFMTISLMTEYPDIFKVGVAGGPVIDWKWYEVMYGERYMGHPEENQDGYALTSLINKAGNLKGKLLICQGAIDPVVVWQHSLSFIRECIVNDIQVDYFPYPCAEHNVMGEDRVHLHDKITMYFEDYL